MRIGRIELFEVRLRLIAPFETSFARETHKEALLVGCFCDGLQGWGEVVAMREPLYNEETLETAWHMLTDFLIPLTFSRTWSSPWQWAAAVRPLRRNYMAKAGLESALWDLTSQLRGESLSRLWGGTRERVESGISLGIEADFERLWEAVEGARSQGYRRLKLKIKPGWDVQPVAELRSRLPEVPLQVDANSAYSLEQVELLRSLDEYNLLLIEQPLAHDDIVDHSRLVEELRTPICLDESIDSLEQCRRALDLNAAQMINIKPGRVGGYCEAIRIHHHCLQRGIPCWVGGMLETGIGRLHNLSLASLPNFTLPGDLSASQRYFERDLIDPPVVLGPDSCVLVPGLLDWQSRLDWDYLEHITLRRKVFENR